VRTEGKPVHGRAMLLGVLKNDVEPGQRIGIVTSRRIGNAVVRNRVRRRLREIVRAARPRLVAGLWLVIVAKVPSATAPFSVLSEEWMQLARRGSILRD
jgi:ribonuclease P protein component